MYSWKATKKKAYPASHYHVRNLGENANQRPAYGINNGVVTWRHFVQDNCIYKQTRYLRTGKFEFRLHPRTLKHINTTSMFACYVQSIPQPSAHMEIECRTILKLSTWASLANAWESCRQLEAIPKYETKLSHGDFRRFFYKATVNSMPKNKRLH